MSGSFGKVSYLGKGEFLLDKGELNKISKKVGKIGMIAGGTGITPMFQLINKIVTSRDPTALSLIYATKFIEDIAFCEDLINFDRSGKLSFFPVVETPNASKWLYGSGRVNEEMISNYMPSPKGLFFN
jgi:cytochrome-b5 reductase